MIKRTETDRQTDGQTESSSCKEVVSVSVQTREEMFVFLRFCVALFLSVCDSIACWTSVVYVRTMLIVSNSSSIR